MRIYIPNVLETTNLAIDGDNHHYIKNVLRIDIGRQFEILTNTEILKVEAMFVEKRATAVYIISRRTVKMPKYRLVVYQALLKREYMDTVVEKLTEIGVTDIVPVISERSLSELKDSTLHRFCEISKSAVLQSEGEFLPKIHEAINLKNIVALEDYDNILFYERESKKTFPKIRSKNVQLVIGPEGGFADSEVARLVSQGFVCNSPIESILKAETAATLFAGLIKVQLDCDAIDE